MMVVCVMLLLVILNSSLSILLLCMQVCHVAVADDTKM